MFAVIRGSWSSDMEFGQQVLVLVTLVLLIQVYTISAIPIDNGVIDTKVQCTPESIAINFTTRNPFSGRIFVQGMSDRPECVRNYFANDGGEAPLITFDFGQCNMHRARTLTPQPGMLQTIVVVISFHRVFITKVDRAYKIQCFYMEADKTVTAQLDVSMLTTESLLQTSPMPSCNYLVRRGSRTGEIVRYAKVGEAVFHEWECQSDQVKILVKNCFVDDGQGNKQLILDDRGCSIDPFILSDLTYENTQAKAWVESHVFKYADKPSVFFQCTVQICTRGEEKCEESSPPRCQSRTTTSVTITTNTSPNTSPRPNLDTTTTTSAPTITAAAQPNLPSAVVTAVVRKRAAEIHTNAPAAILESRHQAEGKFDEVDLLTDPIAVLDLLAAREAPAGLLDLDGGTPGYYNLVDQSSSTTTANAILPNSRNHHYHDDQQQQKKDNSDALVCMSTMGFSLFISATIFSILLIVFGAFYAAYFLRISRNDNKDKHLLI